MQTTNFWNKLHLHRGKITFFLLLFFIVTPVLLHGQNMRVLRPNMNNPDYDKRSVRYGFSIGRHTSAYQVRYSDRFVNPPSDIEFEEFSLDSASTIQPSWSSGFSLGFVLNFKMADYLDFRVMPQFSFYEHQLEYNFINGTTLTKLKETTMIELPLLLKYKSVRRNNHRVYVVGGLRTGFEASAQVSDNSKNTLPIKRFNFSIDIGLGIDQYFPLFKFSPELRFSRGLSNVLTDDINDFTVGLDKLNTNTVSIFLLFE